MPTFVILLVAHYPINELLFIHNRLIIAESLREDSHGNFDWSTA
jgi:hypothetical protein